MNGRQTQEFKVGLFVLGAAVIFMGFLFNMDVLYQKTGYRLRVLFNFASGLEVGAPVQLAGVPVGTVQEVNIQKNDEGKTQVEVVSRIRRDVSIDQDASIRINTKGLLGQKYLEIMPGSQPAVVGVQEKLFMGSDPTTLEDAARTGARVMEKLETSVDGLNRLMGDTAFQKRVRENVTNFGELVVELREVAAVLKVIFQRIRDGEGTLGKLMVDDAIYEDLKGLVADVRKNPWKLLKKR